MSKNTPILPPETDLDTTSKRLKYVIEQSGIKQSHIAKKLGLTRGAIHYILNSECKGSKNTQKIAELLGVDTTWLETGKSLATVISDHESISVPPPQSIPVYYIDQLLMGKQNNSLTISPIAHVFAQRKYNQPLFAIQLSRPSALQKFESGEIIILREQQSSIVGDWVLIYQPQEARMYFGIVMFQENDSLVLLHQKTENLLTLNLKVDSVMGVFVESIKYSNT